MVNSDMYFGSPNSIRGNSARNGPRHSRNEKWANLESLFIPAMSWPVPSRITPYAVRAAKIHITIYPLPIEKWANLEYGPSVLRIRQRYRFEDGYSVRSNQFQVFTPPYSALPYVLRLYIGTSLHSEFQSLGAWTCDEVLYLGISYLEYGPSVLRIRQRYRFEDGYSVRSNQFQVFLGCMS
jgi:hypothetical protein